MADYQVLARKYRPQHFSDVVGQDAIVATLKNAVKHKRVAHAYLLCGPRGTGKTTLARLLAKVLNCLNLNDDFEPCNTCPSCKEITSGSSLDVLEVDGASNRGIEEIRRINETVAYSSSKGLYKVYIIDEVHMLTKEAFNALLKTLEEPPPKVVFVFATTEPHKVLPTIMSRCQRFNLNRIPTPSILHKLTHISTEQQLDIQQEALLMIASRAEGSLRDAESLLDQILAFHEGSITTDVVSTILGIMPKEIFFSLDNAGKEGRLSVAFDIAHQLFSQGKDLNHFLEGLLEHYRNILLCWTSGATSPLLTVSEEERSCYEASAKMITQEQCLTIIDLLVDTQNQMKSMPLGRIALEALLLRIMRTYQRIPIDFLIRRLIELEDNIVNGAPTKPAPLPQQHISSKSDICEDPTPSAKDLNVKQPLPKTEPTTTIAQQSRTDTLLQFAAVELEGSLQKKQNIKFLQ